MIIVLVMAKLAIQWKILSLFQTYVHNKNKQLLLADFSQNKYLIKPFLISTSETHKKI